MGYADRARRTGPAMMQRVHAVLCYLGFAPFYTARARQGASPFLVHHWRQSLGVLSLLLGLAALFAALFVVVSLLLVYNRELYEGGRFEARFLNVFRKLCLAWGVVWVYAIGAAIAGSATPLPIVAWLGEFRRVRRFAIAGLCGAYLLAVLLVPLGWHANAMARASGAAPVYLLYDDVNRYPRTLFTLAFYRMSWTARARFGADAVVARKLTPESLAEALPDARFVFLASHGQAEGLLLEGGRLRPRDVAAMGPAKRLQYVYLAGCDSGAIAAEWEAVFAPAEVMTYARLSAVLEHLWWMWSAGPRVLRALPEING